MMKEPTTHKTVYFLTMATILCGACGGVGKSDIEELKAGDQATSKACMSTEAVCKSAETAAQKEQMACDAAAAVCKNNQATLTAEACTTLYKTMVGDFECEEDGDHHLLSVGLPNFNANPPPPAGTLCAIFLTRATLGVAPATNLRPTSWNASHSMTAFDLTTVTGPIIKCTLW